MLENVEIFSESIDGEEKAEDKQPKEESEHPLENDATDSEVSNGELSKKEVKNSWPIGVPWSPRAPKNDRKKNKVTNGNFEDKFEVNFQFYVLLFLSSLFPKLLFFFLFSLALLSFIVFFFFFTFGFWLFGNVFKHSSGLVQN